MSPSHQDALWTFLLAAWRNPRLVGAVAPNSDELARVLASVVPLSGAPTGVELGPGTGSVSSAIARRLPSSGRHIALEADPSMVAHLHRTAPGLQVLHKNADLLTSVMDEISAPPADAVISGLPWTLIAPPAQKSILRQVGDVMTPHGAFTTFNYLHARRLSSARRFHHLLRASFEEVVVTRTIWRNVPPARVRVPAPCEVRSLIRFRRGHRAAGSRT